MKIYYEQRAFFFENIIIFVFNLTVIRTFLPLFIRRKIALYMTSPIYFVVTVTVAKHVINATIVGQFLL